MASAHSMGSHFVTAETVETKKNTGTAETVEIGKKHR
jgi:hypothetical protein